MNKTVAIRSQARRAVLAKAAEAQPTPEEQAFAAGFCKAAEVMGVDPDALYKEALPAWLGRVGSWIGSHGGNAVARGAQRVGSWIGSHGGNAVANSRVGQSVRRGFGRYWELMRGGNERLVGAYNDAYRKANEIVGKGFAARNPRLREVGHTMAADLTNARFGGGHVQRVYNMNGGQLLTDTRAVLSPETIAELNKSLGARVGTGAAVLGGGAMLFGGGNNNGLA